MGWKDTLSNAAGKVSHTVSQNRDKIEQGIDKGAEFARSKTGGKYDDKIRKGTEQVRSGLDKVSGSESSAASHESGAPSTGGDQSVPKSTPPQATPDDRPGNTPPAAPNKPV